MTLRWPASPESYLGIRGDGRCWKACWRAAIITTAMSTPRRSFWAVLGLAALADGLAITGAAWATRAVLPCWWAPARPAGWEPGAVCERIGWGPALHAWLPAIVLVGVAVASLGSGAVLVGLQLVKARQASRGFGPQMAPGEAVARVAAEAGVARLAVVDEPRSCSCVCIGLLRPRVVISTWVIAALSVDQLAAVLAHEASHARHRDPLLITLARAAGAGLFFVPLAHRLGRIAVARAELAADAAAVAAAGRPALAGALLALDEVAPVNGAMTHVASPEIIDLRIQALRDAGVAQSRKPGWLAGAGGVIVVAFCLVVTAWVQPSNSRAPVVAQVHPLRAMTPRPDLHVPPP